ncbi:MAG: hypothetical protein R2708_05140 [Vicinamibacterales bacterium]
MRFARGWGWPTRRATATIRRAASALVDTLGHIEPARARYLARFAYLLGRVAMPTVTSAPRKRGR